MGVTSILALPPTDNGSVQKLLARASLLLGLLDGTSDSQYVSCGVCALLPEANS